MNKNYLRILLTFVFAIILMCGCSSNEKTTEGMTDIKISAINGVSWAPLFIASSEGFFKTEGLNVEFIAVGGPKGFQAMHAGGCEFSMLSQEPLLIAQDKGIRSTIIATMLNSRVYGIIANPDVKNISELKGSVIYASDPGSAPYTFTCNVLKENGLDPARDVTFMQMNTDAAIMALAKGEIRAAFINMFKVPELKNMEINVLVDATKKEDCLRYLGTNEFPAEMLCTSEEYTKEYPEVCQKVVNAIINAQTWIQKHTDQEVADSLAKHFTAIDKTILAKEVAIMRNIFKPDCFISEDGENAVVNMCLETGLIHKSIPYGEIVDMSFVNNARK